MYNVPASWVENTDIRTELFFYLFIKNIPNECSERIRIQDEELPEILTTCRDCRGDLSGDKKRKRELQCMHKCFDVNRQQCRCTKTIRGEFFLVTETPQEYI